MINLKKITLVSCENKVKFKMNKNLSHEEKLQLSCAFLKLMQNNGLTENDLIFCLKFSKDFDKLIK